MKRILFALLISIISLGNISCKAQDNIAWVQNDVAYENIDYGLLYNWYAATDVRKITSSDDWHVPTDAEWTVLNNYLGGITISGGKLKETGTIHWDNPNIGATNEVGFNGKGSGYRSVSNGIFFSEKIDVKFWSTTTSYDNIKWTNGLTYNSQSCIRARFDATYGFSIRLIKDFTTLTHGQTGTYIGNNGRVYRTICINGVEWLADNLAETKYRNGDAITEVTDNTTWSGLTTGAWCYYNNDPTKK